jgi:hypothetical protein
MTSVSLAWRWGRHSGLAQKGLRGLRCKGWGWGVAAETDDSLRAIVASTVSPDAYSQGSTLTGCALPRNRTWSQLWSQKWRICEVSVLPTLLVKFDGREKSNLGKPVITNKKRGLSH